MADSNTSTLHIPDNASPALDTLSTASEAVISTLDKLMNQCAVLEQSLNAVSNKISALQQHLEAISGLGNALPECDPQPTEDYSDNLSDVTDNLETIENIGNPFSVPQLLGLWFYNQQLEPLEKRLKAIKDIDDPFPKPEGMDMFLYYLQVRDVLTSLERIKKMKDLFPVPKSQVLENYISYIDKIEKRYQTLGALKKCFPPTNMEELKEYNSWLFSNQGYFTTLSQYKDIYPKTNIEDIDDYNFTLTSIYHFLEVISKENYTFPTPHSEELEQLKAYEDLLLSISQCFAVLYEGKDYIPELSEPDINGYMAGLEEISQRLQELPKPEDVFPTIEMEGLEAYLKLLGDIDLQFITFSERTEVFPTADTDSLTEYNRSLGGISTSLTALQALSDIFPMPANSQLQSYIAQVEEIQKRLTQLSGLTLDFPKANSESLEKYNTLLKEIKDNLDKLAALKDVFPTPDITGLKDYNGQIENMQKLIGELEPLSDKFPQPKMDTLNEYNSTLGKIQEQFDKMSTTANPFPTPGTESNPETTTGNRTQASGGGSTDSPAEGAAELNKTPGDGGILSWNQQLTDSLTKIKNISNPYQQILGYMLKAGMDMNKSMTSISVKTQLDGDALTHLQKQLTQIATTNKTDITLAPAGFEKIYTQVKDVDKSLAILDASLKANKIGLGEVEGVSVVLSKTLSAISNESASASEVMDTLLVAGRLGGSGMEEMGQYMPSLIAGASKMGGGYKDAASTFAFMTSKGQEAGKAASLMESAFHALSRVEVQSKMADAGINLKDETGQVRNFSEVMSDLHQITSQMNAEEQLSFLKNLQIEAPEEIEAFSLLTSDLEGLKVAFDQVSNSSGETEKAVARSKDIMEKLTDVWMTLKNAAAQLGIAFIPIIESAISLAEVIAGQVCVVVEQLQEALMPIVETVFQLAEAIAGQLCAVVDQLMEALLPVIHTVLALAEVLAAELCTVVDEVATALEPVIKAILTLAEYIAAKLCVVITTISELISDFLGLLLEGDPILWTVIGAVTALAAAYAAYNIYMEMSTMLSKAKAVWDEILAAKTWLLQAAQMALNSAFLACPLVWIAIAIGAVVAAVITCWNKFEGFRQVIMGVWEVIKGFGRALFDAVVTPIKQIISGISSIGSAIDKLFKRQFAEAAAEAKKGFTELGKGIVNGSPIGMAVNATVNAANVDYTGAWEKGKQRGSESWAASQEKNQQNATEGLMDAEGMTSQITDLTSNTIEQSDKITSATQKAAGGRSPGSGARPGQETPPETQTPIDLNEVASRSQPTELYNAIVQKVSPVSVAMSKQTSTALPDAITGQTEPIGTEATNETLSQLGWADKENEEAEGKDKEDKGPVLIDFIKEITMNVSRIAAVTTVSLMMSMSAMANTVNGIAASVHEISKSDLQMESVADKPLEEESEMWGDTQKNSIYIDRVCDQIVIQVENTDGAGVETIRYEIMKVLNEICEYEG